MQRSFAVEGCIIKLGEVGTLIKMIDEVFTGGDCERLVPKRAAQLESAIILLQDTFSSHYENLQAAFYGGDVVC